MRRLATLLLLVALGATLGACGSGDNGSRAPHLPPPGPGTGTTSIVQGHETTAATTTTPP